MLGGERDRERRKRMLGRERERERERGEGKREKCIRHEHRKYQKKRDWIFWYQ